MRRAGTPPANAELYAARIELIRDLILSGITRTLITRAVRSRTTVLPEDDPTVAREKRALATRLGMPLTDRQINETYDKVRKSIAEEFETDRPTARAVQSARLEQDLLRIRSEIERAGSAGVRERLFLAVSRHEELTARITGTMAPQEVRVDATVDARRTLIAVVMGLSEEEQERLLADQRQRDLLGDG